MDALGQITLVSLWVTITLILIPYWLRIYTSELFISQCTEEKNEKDKNSKHTSLVIKFYWK